MATTTYRGFRPAAATVLLIGGAGVAAVTWIGGDHRWAVAAIAAYLMLAIGSYPWAGRSGDVAALLRAGGDERQRGLDRDATAHRAGADPRRGPGGAGLAGPDRQPRRLG